MNVIACGNCNETLLKLSKWDRWLRILHFIECLELQGCITLELKNEMIETWIWFKPSIEEEIK